MSDLTTIARPYAKAIFEYGLGSNQLADWSEILHQLAQAILQPDAEYFINNPSGTIEQQCQLLLAVISESGINEQQKEINNLIGLLADNKRLILLPDIYAQYEALRAEQEKTLVVEVRCYAELSDTQQQQLIKSLKQRLQRQITLNMTVDTSLIGGAVVQAGDLVIDGSVRGQINKLRTRLAA